MRKLVDDALHRHSVLQCQTDGGSQRIHQPTNGGAFLRHGDEQFARRAVFVETNDQVALMASNVELVRERLPRVRQTATTWALNNALHHALHFNHALDDAINVGSGGDYFWQASSVFFFTLV